MESHSAAGMSKTPEAWLAELGPEAYAVLREAATERPFTGAYTDEFSDGSYVCRACGAALFESSAKFHSRCGWPSFYAPSETDSVTLHDDVALGAHRIEVRCRTCGSHLGHVFRGEGYPTPSDERYCINSIALVLRRGSA